MIRILTFMIMTAIASAIFAKQRELLESIFLEITQ